jgi:peptide/nickel transport system substrate-binding protein
MSRRRFLASMASAAGTATLLAACGGAPGGTDPTAASVPTGDAPTPTTATAATGPTTFASQIDTAGITPGGTIIEGSTADVRTLNPVLTSDTASSRITSLVFDSLVDIDPDTLEPTSNLAESWTVSDDSTVFTFTIKSGVTFHDGQPLTAADVKFTYDLLMNPDTGTPRAGSLNAIVESVEAPDDTTVVFTLKEVDAGFLVSELGYGIVPQHILGDLNPADLPTSEFTTTSPIGTGPFKFQEFRAGELVTLVANPEYHRGAPALESYIRKFVKDPTALFQQLKTGEVDFAGFDPSFYEEAIAQDNFTTFAYDTFNFTFFGYNLDPEKGSPIFQDVKVRQALFYAIDRPGIISTVRNGLSTLAYGTMPVLSWAYQPDQITSRYDYDPDRAGQLLDEAGWTMGTDGIREKDGQKLSFTVNAQSGNKAIDGFLAVFQENWRQIGVEMTPAQEEFSQFVTRLTKTFDFAVFLVGFSWGTDPDQRSMWHSDSYPAGFNLFKYSNPEVDQTIDAASKTLDQEQRKELYLQMQNLVLADAPALITDFPKTLAGVNNRVKNLIPNAVSITQNAHQWYVMDGG